MELMREYGFLKPALDAEFTRFWQRYRRDKGHDGHGKIRLPSGREMTLDECRAYSLRKEVTRACARFHGLTEGQQWKNEQSSVSKSS